MAPVVAAVIISRAAPGAILAARVGDTRLTAARLARVPRKVPPMVPQLFLSGAPMISSLGKWLPVY
jgi:hypothetical protein